MKCMIQRQPTKKGEYSVSWLKGLKGFGIQFLYDLIPNAVHSYHLIVVPLGNHVALINIRARNKSSLSKCYLPAILWINRDFDQTVIIRPHIALIRRIYLSLFYKAMRAVEWSWAVVDANNFHCLRIYGLMFRLTN